MYVLSQLGLYLLLSLPLIGAYLMLAVGIVVIFRASRVLNLAHGAMAAVPAYVTYSLVNSGVPTVLALAIAVASGGAFGVVVERLFVRPLARQGPTAQTVGTVAVYGLVVALLAQIYGSGSKTAVPIFPSGGIHVSTVTLRWGDLGLFVVGLICLAGAIGLLRFTRVGLAMRGAAENPAAAALMGINPLRMARLAWALGGALAGLAGALLASVTSLDPYSLSLQMLPGFVAALLGGLGALGGALIGAVVVGAVEGLVPVFSLVPGLRSLAGQVGVPELTLTVVALVIMFLRGQRYSVAETGGGLAPDQMPATTQTAFDPDRLPRRGGRRRLSRNLVFAGLLAWPFMPLGFLPVDQFSLLGDAIQAGEYFLVAASLVLLTGWVGQISLAQAAFVGIGAFGTAMIGQHMSLPFPLGLVAGGILGGVVAAGLGLVALRVRGLYLAVATLIFAWMADAYLFIAHWFAAGGNATLTAPTVGHQGSFPYFDFTDRRTFYFVTLAVCGLVAFALLNLRDSKTGRAFSAVRGSETAAAAMGVDVVRAKLLAFVLAGGIAGMAGNLIITNQTAVVSDQFDLQSSLLFLAIAVVGGLRSLSGAVGASVLFAALNEIFFRVPALGRLLQLVSAILLAAVLLAYPGGLAAIPATVRRVRRRLGALSTLLPRQRAAEVAYPAEASSTTSESEPKDDVEAAPERRRPIPGAIAVAASGITVRFGGLTAVSEASLTVPASKIVGLIGPNGAGKTTLFNAISGLNQPTEGTVNLFGSDVTGLPAHQRAARGLARTFQVIQLFPDLTVFENLMVATHVLNPTGAVEHLLATGRSVSAEVAAEETCRRVVRQLGLQDIADRHVAGLPFGTLRLVEFARALVTGAPLVMLDEPASGLDESETAAFAAVLRKARAELDLSVLLIEHDVQMVTSVSDYIYVLDRGQIIAEGEPGEIQRDPRVLAAYLGEPAGSSEPVGATA